MTEICEYEKRITDLEEGRRGDDEYWFEIVEKRDGKIKILKKEVSHWKGQYNAKIKRNENSSKVYNHKLKELIKEFDNTIGDLNDAENRILIINKIFGRKK